MKRSITLRRAAAVAAISLLPTAASAQQTESYSLQGERVAIYDLAGHIRVVSGTGANVVVEVVRRGEDRARLSVDRRTVRDRAALIVRFPGDRIVYHTDDWSGRTELRLRDDGTFGDGRVDGGTRVRISSSGRGVEASADLVVRVPAGRSVEVFAGVGRVDVRNVEGDLLIDVASARVDADDVKGDLAIDTGSGAVRVRNVTGKRLRVDTGSGGVEVNSARATDIEIDTGSGGVEGAGLRAQRLVVDTGSGRIDLTDVAAPEIRLDTGSGGVSLDLRADVDRLRIDTGSGGVRLRLASEVGAELDVDTGSGGIDVDVPVRVRRSERGHFNGVLGDGRGRIEIDTGSGGVRVTSR